LNKTYLRPCGSLSTTLLLWGNGIAAAIHCVCSSRMWAVIFALRQIYSHAKA